MRKLLLLLVMIVSYVCPSMAAKVGDVYTKVTSGDQLTAGSEYVLVYTETGSKYYAMGAISGKFFACVQDAYDLSADGNTLTIKSDAVQEFTLVNGTANGTFAFKFTGSDNADSYMQCTGTSNNSMGTNSKLVANCNMSITLGANGAATIIPTSNSNQNKNKFQCNANKDQERFSNYKTGTQKNPTFYVKAKFSNVEKPVISIANAKVSITTETEGATIYYTTDGTTPDNNSTKYGTEFEVVPATTYMAVAEKDGEYSSVATKISSAACGEIVFNPSEGAVEKATEVTVSAENAASFVYSVLDADANYLVEAVTVNGSSFTYIVNQECTISATPSNADGVVGTEATATYTIKAAAPCGVVTFSPAAGEVLEGTEVTISAENATSYKYFVLDSEANFLVEETTVDAATFTYVVNQNCTIDVIPYNVDNVAGEEADAEYTVKERTGVTHHINGLSFGTKGNGYAEYTYTADDITYLARINGVYASGQSQSKVTSNFGIRTSDGSSVVVSAKPSNWVVKSIKITQYSGQSTAKTAIIYGSNKPFESANVKASELTDAVEIGRDDMQKGVAVAIDIHESPYIAIYSSDGPLQIEDLEIVWDKPEAPELATILVDEQPISGNSVSLDGKEKVVVTFSHAHPLATFWYKHTSPTEQESVNGFARVSEGFTQVEPNADNKYAVEITDAGRFEYFTHLNGIETEHNYMDFTGQTTGVEDVVVGQDQNAEYYDLTGRRVLNPVSGLYIKVVGGKATKTYIR